MRKIVIHSGFHPEVRREYKGEHIYPVIAHRIYPEDGPAADRKDYYQIANRVWIKSLGNEKYVSDWCDEERWGRAEEIVTDGDGREESKTLGFIILRVDRKNHLL